MPDAAPHLAELLHALAAAAIDGEPLHVVIERGGRRVELTAGPMAPAIGGGGVQTMDPPAADVGPGAGGVRPLAGAEPACPAALPAYSPTEARIVAALKAAPGPLLGKVVARRTGLAYDPKLKTLLANLVERGDLTHGADGYALVSASGERDGPREDGGGRTSTRSASD